MTLDLASTSRPRPSGHPSRRTFPRAAVYGLALSSLLIGCGGGGGDPESAAPANRAPASHAGAAQNVSTGTVVTLNGSASADPDNDSLSYRWAFSSRPNGSAATLSGASTATPNFTADMPGTYVATLVVNDGLLDSTAATVSVVAAAANVAPVANAGPAQKKLLRSTVQLDGSASADLNGDTLAYQWTLTSRPAGSQAVLSNTSSVKPTFSADKPGVYVASLVVKDGKVRGDSPPASVTVTVIPVFGYAAYKMDGNPNPGFYPDLSHNSYTGNASGIGIFKSETGSYTVSFDNLGDDKTKYTVLVSNLANVGEDVRGHCVANTPSAVGTTLRAAVLCADRYGGLMDTGFMVLVLGEQALSGPNVIGSGRADGTLRVLEASGDVTVTGGAIHTSVGSYDYELGRMPTAASPGYFQFSGAVATGGRMCYGGWASGSARVYVGCQDLAQNQASSQFNFALLTAGREGRAYTMLTADIDPSMSAPTYTPRTVKTSASRPPTVTKKGTGYYEVNLPGLGTSAGVSSRTLIVSSVGLWPGSVGCNVAGPTFPFSHNADGSMTVQVFCYGEWNGVEGPANTPFNLLVMQ